MTRSFLLFLFYCYVAPLNLHSFPTRRSSDLVGVANESVICQSELRRAHARTSVLVAENSGLHRIDGEVVALDRKSTRLNSSHTVISYAVFCLKKKNQKRSVLRFRAAASLLSR